ncbi:GNAT family N-acetyltransferase [Paenarthrobacter sp. Z7-10]|uniref:GNAT family N-acetyltransferase n=1 Tax=Paenarthrobacter sp. Z7-10 TaxID=2787635 RepID=UPI0022A990A5|nr:GNAT family N-acetyltransferase [Paenarthrobacter sp. Z7-10]MCZ2403362.1 GNAT family N-acetyltransferase [Paenarthrobacter sp. Z7-10]
MRAFSIRAATAEDAEELVRMHTAAHEEAYGPLLPPEFFAGRRANIAARIEQRRDALLSGYVPLLAYDDDDGQLVGIAHAGPGRDDDAPTELELQMIYALERVHGHGVGQALLDAAVGTAPAFLWVLAENPRAQAFYAKNGFVPDGAHKLLPDSWCNLPEIRMVRRHQAGQGQRTSGVRR